MVLAFGNWYKEIVKLPQVILGCQYPTAAEFQRLQQELLPRYMNGRLAFDLLPFKNTDFPNITFNKPDIFRGLQQWRGLDKPTQHVKDEWNPFGSLVTVEPSYWGEHDHISEEFMTRAAMPGACNSMIDVTEIIAQRQMRLLERRYNRIEFLIWQALVFGKYEALAPNGQIMHQATYNIQQVTAGIPWSDIANSTPLADFRCIQLRSRGTSADFGTCATAYMNRITANCLFKNQNVHDVGKVGLSACCNFMSLEQINAQFAAQGLPKIEIYDQGYVDESENFHTYIPDGYILIVGCRPGGVPPGHFYYTRNAIGCGITSGPWQKIIDSCDREVPRRISLYDAWAGGPALEYPRQVVVLRTGCASGTC